MQNPSKTSPQLSERASTAEGQIYIHVSHIGNFIAKRTNEGGFAFSTKINMLYIFFEHALRAGLS